MLTKDEITQVSGGFGFEADDGPPIVVDGRRYTGLTVEQALGLIGDGAFDGYVDGTGDLGGGSGDNSPPPEEECSDHGDSDDSNRPEGFDPEMDREIDRQASDLADEINGKSDAHLREYSAIVWRDSNGNLHSTQVHPGSETNAPLDAAWAQVDFANGGQVVAILHSHPTHFDSGNGIVPITSDTSGLSNTDFDQLLDYSDFNSVTGTFDGEGLTGIDADNFRSYIVTADDDGANVKEFYASDQDVSQYGQDDSMTVSSEISDDYDQNTSEGSSC